MQEASEEPTEDKQTQVDARISRKLGASIAKRYVLDGAASIRKAAGWICRRAVVREQSLITGGGQ